MPSGLIRRRFGRLRFLGGDDALGAAFSLRVATGLDSAFSASTIDRGFRGPVPLWGLRFGKLRRLGGHGLQLQDQQRASVDQRTRNKGRAKISADDL
jgi:hypothetical protein